MLILIIALLLSFQFPALFLPNHDRRGWLFPDGKSQPRPCRKRPSAALPLLVISLVGNSYTRLVRKVFVLHLRFRLASLRSAFISAPDGAVGDSQSISREPPASADADRIAAMLSSCETAVAGRAISP
jgi:hypothetical protein